MKQILKNFPKINIVLLIVLIFVLIPIFITFALDIHNPLGGISDINSLLKNIVGFLIVLAIPISMILVVYSGFLYITSAGNEDKIKTAQKTLIWALVGFAVVLVARSVPVIIENILYGESTNTTTTNTLPPSIQI